VKSGGNVASSNNASVGGRYSKWLLVVAGAICWMKTNWYSAAVNTAPISSKLLRHYGYNDLFWTLLSTQAWYNTVSMRKY